ncbi:ATP-binding cassette domain-containing protein [Methanosarcina sp.]|uniref:ATP-binding cassette domain-containing protein n=1 Tax=Methanosarcina sp. TaxID=2213 RepID=UPI003BB74B57
MIKVKNLSKFYGSTKAVNDVSLSIGKGELFGLLGPNGSGKTTIIKMLTGQIKPTSGSIRVHGVDVLEDPVRVRELVGVIPEQETPPSFLTAEEYLYFVAKIRKMEHYEEVCEKWLEFFDFGEQKNSLFLNLIININKLSWQILCLSIILMFGKGNLPIKSKSVS